MVKGKTAEQVWIGFLLEYRRMPEKEEFMDLGYSRATYYRMKSTMPCEYILAQQWVEQHWRVCKTATVGDYKLTFKEMI